MQQDQWQFLLSDQGQALLAQAAELPLNERTHLQLASDLRQQVAPDMAQAVVETTWLRQRAASKFSKAAEMYFTRPALEQASAEVIAEHHARRFQAAGIALVADLGCSVGGDAVALAAAATVIGVDREWLRLAMARENTAAYGRGERFEAVQADLNELAPLDVQGVFFDPARRDDRGRRIRSVHQYQPPLALIDQWRAKVPEAAVKISPAVDYAELPPDAEVEFISVGGDVREGVLWYGALRRENERRATLLPHGDTLTELDHAGTAVTVTLPGNFLYEPDGAVIRAHLVQTLARALDATQIDAEIAYLTAPQQITTPFARCFSLEAWFPFQLKRLRHYLREQNVGQVTVKKRGSPIDPLILQKQLRLKGNAERVVFLTHVLGEPAVLIGQEVF
jgi:hypothetical protein